MNFSPLPSVPLLNLGRVIKTSIVLVAFAVAIGLTLSGGGATRKATPPPVPRPLYNTGVVYSQAATQNGPMHGPDSIASAGAERKSVRPSSRSGSSSLPSNIIRTGDITVRLKSKTALGAKQQLAQRLNQFTGSYVASDSAYDHNRYVDMQIEVPVSDFQAVLTILEDDFGKVESESSTTQDVGVQVVDLNARLANLDAQRLALLKLFDKASTVASTIRVENVLSGVEGQIQETAGQIKYLDHQIADSTISVEFQAKNAHVHHHHVTNTILNAFGTAGKGIIGVIAGTIIVVGYAIPLTIVGFVAYGLILLSTRFLRRKQSVSSPVAA